MKITNDIGYEGNWDVELVWDVLPEGMVSEDFEVVLHRWTFSSFLPARIGKKVELSLI